MHIHRGVADYNVIADEPKRSPKRLVISSKSRHKSNRPPYLNQQAFTIRPVPLRYRREQIDLGGISLCEIKNKKKRENKTEGPCGNEQKSHTEIKWILNEANRGRDD